VLQSASIVAVIGEFEPAGMAEYVWVDCKRHLCGIAEPYHEMVEAHGADWSATLRNEHIGFAILTPQPAQSTDLVTADRMDARRSTLGSTDMQPALVELDLMPFEAADLRSPP
jgi:hypothetical protein